MNQAFVPSLNRWWVSLGNTLYHARKLLLPVVAVGLIIAIRPSLFLGNEALDRLIMILAILIAVAGEALRLATIGYAYIHRGGKNRRVYATKLVVKGLYAHTRNPMYAGNFLVTIGLSLLYGSAVLTLLIFLTFGFVYFAVISAEENFLKNKFGREYENYMRSTNRFWPRLRGLGRSLQELDHYNWRKALDKESGTIIEALLTGGALVAWKTYYLYGFVDRPSTVAILAAVLILTLAFALTVHYLRKRGHLVSSLPDEHSDPG